MSDLKTSLLINRQVPEFVREEYPLFISFLEAYYEFLENKQGTQKNDLTTKAKELRDVSDVDASIDEFEENFFNTYASLVPRESEVDRAFLIKNILPLYLSKGNEKSFKFLFRMLFNDEVEIKLPKSNVLRASDGKWNVDKILKLETDIRSVYTANGNTSLSAVESGNTVFNLAQIVDSDEIDVYVNDVIQTEGTDYFLRKETRKLIFLTPPSTNSIVKVFYNDFDISLINNRKLTGVTSGTTALVERATKRIITDRLNFGLPFELFISDKTLVGNFINGETINVDIIDDSGTLINLEADSFSILTKIDVVFGGAGYNVGDPVLVVGGGASVPASAEVESVSSGFTSRIIVFYGGAGFKTASLVSGSNTTAGGTRTVIGAVDSVNTAHYTANTYTVKGIDIIEDYKTVLINSADYGFPNPGVETQNTRIIDALTHLTITDLGPITNVVVLFSNVSLNVTSLDSEGAKYAAGNTFYDIRDFRSVGRIDILNAGTGYKLGEEITFTNPVGTIGFGAAAAVSSINTATGAITSIQIQPARVPGTANVLNNTVEIIGTGTTFVNDLQVGDRIIFRNQERYVNNITSNTSVNVNVAFSWLDGTTWANNLKVGAFSLGPVGGQNYDQNNLPILSVTTTSGNGANLLCTALMGDGEQMSANSDTFTGQIQSIKLTTGGTGYQFIPQIDLTNSGNGTALANAVLGEIYTSLPGRWTTSDSILSSSERKLQGANYYVDYSYVTSSITEFAKYKNVLKLLLHPAGFVNYADLNEYADTNAGDEYFDTLVNDTVSGRVSTTNGSIFVTGTGTLFNVANGNTINIGSQISVNNEIRTVNNFISNTNLSVSVAFTQNSNSQTIVIY